MSTVVYAVCTNNWSDEAKPRLGPIVCHNGITLPTTSERGLFLLGWPLFICLEELELATVHFFQHPFPFQQADYICAPNKPGHS